MVLGRKSRKGRVFPRYANRNDQDAQHKADENASEIDHGALLSFGDALHMQYIFWA